MPDNPRPFLDKLFLAAVLCGVACAALAGAWISRALAAQSQSPDLALRAQTTLSVPSGIRQVSLATKDIVYDPVGQRIYASVPSSAANGNSLTQIDPFAGTIGASVFMGSEPGRLAISGNSQYIYASLDGAAAVRRFDIAAQTAGLQFPLGSDNSFGAYYVGDMEVLPGQPDSVAVSRRYLNVSPSHAGVAIYDNGLPRPTTTATHTGSNVIEFGASADSLYGYNTDSTEFGFRKMAVSSSGVSVTSTTSGLISGFGVDIRFAGGLIYSTNGRVINPEMSLPVGSFPGIGFGALVVIDPSVNRVYFLTGSGSSTLVLKAFDRTTFIQTGSLSIPGVSGGPGSFIKWADNGLAFRTSGNQIFLLSTADIVPVTPTATPTPAQVTTGINRLPLTTNDIVYDPNTQRVYASLPGTAGSFGNSIASINPQTGEMNNPIFIGSEPRKLAISDNGQYLYAGLDGAASIRRFDVASQVPGLQFALGPIQSNGPMTTDDLAVLPGSPGSIAVARGNTNPPFDSVAVFDDGVLRPNAAQSGTSIEFSASASTLYAIGQNTSFNKLAVTASGVSVVATIGNLLNGAADMRYDNSRIYSTNGRVVDPEAGVAVGSFFGASGLVVPDSNAGQIYYLNGGSTTVTLKSFDPNTFTLTGTLTINGVVGTPGGFIKAGANLLAFRTESQVYFVATSAIQPAPTTLPTPVPVTTGIIQLPLAANDLVYDPNTQKVYASVPSSAGSFGNSLAPIDPVTGTMSAPIFLGSEPRKLAISNDNQVIYAGLDGMGAVRRFDLASQTAGMQFSLGNGQFSGQRLVDDMAVVPGDSNAVAVARRNTSTSPRFEGVAIYDSGVPRPTTITNNNLTEVIEFSAWPSTLYGYNNESTEFAFRKMFVNSSGVSIASNLSTSIAGFGIDLKYDNGKIYASTGRVINAESGAALGTFSGANSLAFVPDASVKRTYFVAGTGGPTTLQAFDQNTFLAVGSLSIPNVSGTPLKMIRWGTNGLAFTTSGNQIYFIQDSALVPPSSMNPSSTTVTSSANPINFGQTVTFTAIVSSASDTPTGTVQFQDNGINVGSSQPLTSGVATWSTSTLGAGAHVITAIYSGDANFLISGGTLAPAQAVLPFLSISDAAISEGNSGAKTVTFTVTLSPVSNQTVTVNYASANGTATIADNDYQSASGTLSFAPGNLTKTFTVTVNGDQRVEPDETFLINLTDPVNATISDSQGLGVILNDDTSVQFGDAAYSIDEGSNFLSISVVRAGNTSAPATVKYASSDATDVNFICNPNTVGQITGAASRKCDYHIAAGRLRFAAGETSKTIVLSIVNDVYVEGSETLTVSLGSPTGASLGSPNPATVTITDNDAPGQANPIDDTAFYVRMLYVDLLSREPDPAGLNGWIQRIDLCGQAGQLPPPCDRVTVGGDGFLRSAEFFDREFFVIRLYRTALGRIPRYDDVGDLAFVSGFLTDADLELNKQELVTDIMSRPEFVGIYNSLSNAPYVDTMIATAAVTLPAGVRNNWLSALNGGTKTRAQVFRELSERPEVSAKYLHEAQVVSCYYGFFTRNPDGAYFTFLQRYDNGEINLADLANAFINAAEYRQRFGP